MLTNSASSGNIKFLAVARAVDKAIVASYIAKKGDFSSEQYYTSVNEVLSSPDFSSKVSPGARYRLSGEVNAFNFTIDSQNRVYIVITTSTYPERTVFKLILEDFIPKFKTEFGDRSLTAQPSGLDKACARLFQILYEDYDDPTKKDKITKVQVEVEGTREVITEAMNEQLKNLQKSDDIEIATQKLQEQAKKYAIDAERLKNQERWKNYKICAAVSFVVVILLIIIIASLANQGGNNNSG